MVGAARGYMDDLDSVGRLIAIERQRPAGAGRLPPERMIGREIESPDRHAAKLACILVEHAVDEHQPRPAQPDKMLRIISCLPVARVRQFGQRIEPRPAPPFFPPPLKVAQAAHGPPPPPPKPPPPR